MAGDGPRPVRGLRRKAVLATLALHAGAIVSTGRLAEVVWGEDAPATAVNTLQSHVSYLRTVLGDKTAIRARPPGYLLDLNGDQSDVQVAERLLRQGTDLADPAQGVRHLRAALALWRGQPLADVTGLAWLEEQAEQLQLLCLQIRRALAEARLAIGEHAQLVPDLEKMAVEYPLDEHVHAQLMLALYRSGRQADALAVFHRMRNTLAEQLGIDPVQALRDLETAILQQDPSVAAPVPAVTLAPAVTPAPAAPPSPVPAQLPPAVAGFAGREPELATLDRLLDAMAATSQEAPAAVAISVISGTPGVGKTALALHWAHRAKERFPDGQLYVNLRGFDPGGAALDPDEAVCGFLDTLGVPAAQVPPGLAARAALYRSVLAGKRILVVLDNARDPEQVRPLLPGSAGCTAIVTSRSDLTGLAAVDGAHSVPLKLLSVAEARSLLTRRLGLGRVAAEPDAADDIIARCARLPLALAIAAARAATAPGFPLAAIAAELSEVGRSLDPFDGGDLAADVRAVFSWSYRELSGDAARLFRLLGLHPGPDIAVTAAASLAAVPPGQARTLLRELTRAHLLAEHSPGRYACHDLLRAYAAELAHACDSQDARDAAVLRVLDHYLHTVNDAAMPSDPWAGPLVVAAPQPGVTVTELASAEDVLAWFAAEHTALLGGVQLAAATGLATHAWQLAWHLSSFLLRRGQWEEQAGACRAALAAARRAGDATGQAYATHGLALGYARSGRDDDAVGLFEDALERFADLGDATSQALIHSGLTWLSERRLRPTDMLSHARKAFDLYGLTGDRAGQMMIQNDIGYSYALLGNYERALTYCERSLAGLQELGQHGAMDAVLDSLGYIHHRLGNHEKAVTCYKRSIELCRSRADRYNEAATLDHLGDVYRSAGDIGAARRAWALALRIFDQLGHPDGDPVRAKLFPAGGRLHAVALDGEPGDVTDVVAAQQPDWYEQATASLRK
jgi:DNA-binding SARP family transcriptional activator/tetratricopeptide (TPR) repeat protein